MVGSSSLQKMRGCEQKIEYEWVRKLTNCIWGPECPGEVPDKAFSPLFKDARFFGTRWIFRKAHHTMAIFLDGPISDTRHANAQFSLDVRRKYRHFSPYEAYDSTRMIIALSIHHAHSVAFPNRSRTDVTKFHLSYK